MRSAGVSTAVLMLAAALLWCCCTAAAAVTSAHSSPAARVTSAAATPSASAPAPLFPAGDWTGERVEIPSSVCANYAAPADGPSPPLPGGPQVALRQDKRPAHWTKWWSSCWDQETYNVGVWDRRNSSWTTLLSSVSNVLALDQDAASGLLFILMAPTDDQLTALHSVDPEVGASSLRTIVSAQQCTIPFQPLAPASQFAYHRGELLVACITTPNYNGNPTTYAQTIFSVTISATLNETALRPLLNTSTMLVISLDETTGEAILTTDGGVFSYQLGSNGTSQQQPVLLWADSTVPALCDGGLNGAMRLAAGGPLHVLCAGEDDGSGHAAPSTMLVVTDSRVTDEQSLADCATIVGGFAVDRHKQTALLSCVQIINEQDWYAFQLYQSGRSTPFVTSSALLLPIVQFDRESGAIWIHAQPSSTDSSAPYSASSLTGHAATVMQIAPACLVADVSLSVAEAAGVWYSCLHPPAISFVAGQRVAASYALAKGAAVEALAAVSGSDPPEVFAVVEHDSQFQLLHLRLSGGQLVGGTAGALSSGLMYPALWWHRGWLYLTWDSDEMQQSLSRVDPLTAATNATYVSTSNSLQPYFLDGQILMWLEMANGDRNTVLQIGANFTSNTNATQTPISCGPAVAITTIFADADMSQLWIACAPASESVSGALLLYDVESQSMRPPPPVAVPAGTVTGLLRAPLTGAIFWRIQLTPFVTNALGEMYQLRACWPPVLDAVTNVVYTQCDGQSISALSTDFSCSPGSGWMDGACQTCAVGSSRAPLPFDPLAHFSPQCDVCALGSNANVAGSDACVPCGVGEYQQVQGQACSVCQPGWSQNATGSSACNACLPGSYSSDIRFSDCIPAPPGSYVPRNRSSSSTLCARGSASSVSGRAEPCPDCAAGFEAPFPGSTECTPCALGAGSIRGGACSQCPVSTYTPAVGALCVRCTDADQSGLECSNGLAAVNEGWWAYLAPSDDSPHLIYRTTACPAGFCPGSALQIAPALYPNGSVVSNVTAAPQLCTWPRLSDPSNWLCAECEPGFVPWGAQCDRCTRTNHALVFGYVLLGVALVVFLLATGTSAADQLPILTYFVQTAALELPPTESWLNWLQLSNLSAKSIPNCLAPITPLQQTTLTLLTPLIMLAALAAVALLLTAMRRCCFSEDVGSSLGSAAPTQCCSQAWFHSKLHRLSRACSLSAFVGCAFAILLFCYTATALAVSESLHCVEIAPGVHRLFSAPTVDCGAGAAEYQSFRSLVIAWLLVYIIGLPLGALAFLIRYRERLHEQSADFQKCFGPLYLSFSESGRYWVPALLLRQFCFALVSNFLISSPAAKYIAFAAMHFVWLLLLLWAIPFASPRLNKVEGASYAVLFAFSIVLAFASLTSSPLSVGTQLLLLALVLVPSLAMAAHAWVAWHKAKALQAKPGEHAAAGHQELGEVDIGYTAM